MRQISVLSSIILRTLIQYQTKKIRGPISSTQAIRENIKARFDRPIDPVQPLLFNQNRAI